MEYNYESLKRLAKERGISVNLLIALNRNNDPFYVGTPQDWIDARWFAEQWNRLGYRYGVHIRRMHYAIVSASPAITMPSGIPYTNTEKCYEFLNLVSKKARYLELVDPAAFVDRRNEPPVTSYIDTTTELKASVYTDDAEQLGDIELNFPSIPSYYVGTFTSPQRYHLEIWCEKSTMNDVFRPLLWRYGAGLVYAKGEISTSMALEAIKRFQKADKPVRIFYVSDFDPAGVGMPTAMARKIEYFIHKLDLDIDVKIFPVALTAEQVEYYKHQTPPILPTPIKEKELRKAKFEQRYGNGDGEDLAVELDALETLYPGELASILRSEMDRYYDHTLSERVQEASDAHEAYLEDLAKEVHARYADDLEGWRTIKKRFRLSLMSRLKSACHTTHNAAMKSHRPSPMS